MNLKTQYYPFLKPAALNAHTRLPIVQPKLFTKQIIAGIAERYSLDAAETQQKGINKEGSGHKRPLPSFLAGISVITERWPYAPFSLF